MAIAYDTSSQASRASSGSSNYTYSHTCTGSDGFLVTGATVVNPSGNFISGITYNGVSMSQQATAAPQTNINVKMFTLVAPSTGSNTVSVTTNANIGSYSDSASASYTGVASSSTIEDAQSGNGAATSFSEVITSTTNNAWGAYWTYSGATPSASTGCTNRQSCISGSIRSILGDTGGAITPAGSHTFNFTAGGADNYGTTAIAFAEAGGGGATFTPKVMFF